MSSPVGSCFSPHQQDLVLNCHLASLCQISQSHRLLINGEHSCVSLSSDKWCFPGALLGQNLSSMDLPQRHGDLNCPRMSHPPQCSLDPFPRAIVNYFFALFLLFLLACLSSCLQFSSSLQHIGLIPFIFALLLLPILFFGGGACLPSPLSFLTCACE